MIKFFQEHKIKLTTIALSSAIITYKYLQSKKNSEWHNSIDKQSLANLDEVITIHHDFDLEIDFKNEILKGKIVYTFKSLRNGLSQVKLDLSNIIISNAEQDDTVISFQLIKPKLHQKTLGSQIILHLNTLKQKDEEFKLTLSFQTQSEKDPKEPASALNWLLPSQTLGKEHPYLFTQSQPIFCRSMFPCQDSPSVKATFTAKLSVSRHLSAWCSGTLVGNKYNKSTDTSTYHFRQETPIPSYLFGICAGNLEQRQIGTRCSVITEPEFIDDCANELENMEQYLQELENYTIPYEWGEYKIVILPPSFLYGGMEYPTLTFASPTIIVGDKSCTDLVIHEMAHSWSGNLVSCKNWENFWLNEGMTMFLENKINKKLNGTQHYKVIQTLQDEELKIDIDDYAENPDIQKRYTSLIPDLKHDNPDDAFSLVPYIKGCQFLTYLEQKVGEDVWEQFIKKYFSHFKNQSIDTKQFLDFLKKFMLKTFSRQQFENIWNSIDFKTWLHTPGMPPKVLDFSNQLIDVTQKIADGFLEDENYLQKDGGQKIQTYNNLKMELKVLFFNRIYDKMNSENLNLQKIKILDETLKIMELEKNPEIIVKFILIGINYKYIPVMELVPEFLEKIGRMKFCRPVYKELVKCGLTDLGKQIFERNINFYHAIAAKMIAKDLKIIQ